MPPKRVRRSAAVPTSLLSSTSRRRAREETPGDVIGTDEPPLTRAFNSETAAAQAPTATLAPLFLSRVARMELADLLDRQRQLRRSVIHFERIVNHLSSTDQQSLYYVSILAVIAQIKIGIADFDRRTIEMLAPLFSPVSDVVSANEGEADGCLICLEPLVRDFVRFPRCHHMFHKGCIEQWLIEMPSCPTCRRHVLSADSPQTRLPDALPSGSSSQENF